MDYNVSLWADFKTNSILFDKMIYESISNNLLVFHIFLSDISGTIDFPCDTYSLYVESSRSLETIIIIEPKYEGKLIKFLLQCVKPCSILRYIENTSDDKPENFMLVSYSDLLI